MAARTASGGRRLSDKCLLTYIFTTMKTRKIRVEEENQKEGLEALGVLHHVPKATTTTKSHLSLVPFYIDWLIWFLHLPSGKGLSGDNINSSL